jgi:hypothetical protein
MITAKLRLDSMTQHAEGYAALSFSAPYRDESGNLINQEWAYATPHLSAHATVRADVAEHFEQGKTYLVTFEEE